MSHQIESMAYVNQVPWHGLGNRLGENNSIEIWTQQSGLNFEIKETPVRFMTESVGSLGAIMSFPEQKVLYRSDTKAALSVVSSRYQVVQPKEILEFYRDLTEISGYQLETAGVLKGGRKVWALARTNQSTTLKGNDTINGYILLATACDGSLATSAFPTTVRVVCQNTLAIALANGSGVVKVPHSTIFDAKAVKQKLGISVSSFDSFMYQMKTLSERKVKNHEAMNYFLRVFNDQCDPSTTLTNERAMTKVQALFDGNGKGAELTSAKGTAFGLLNAVTEYCDHLRRARSVDHRLESTWFGSSANLKQRALDHALMMIA